MAYERNTLEGIRSWLDTEVSSPGWNASSIAKGLTEDVMTIIGNHIREFDSRIKQGLLLSILTMRKNDIRALETDIQKIIQGSLNDSNEFVDIIAHILEVYPKDQQLKVQVDNWSSNFKALVTNIGSKISEQGFKYHPLEDMALQLNARVAPTHAASTYMDFQPTHIHHFTLTTDEKDIIVSEARHARFKELIELEERAGQETTAKKRPSIPDLTSVTKRPAVSPTTNQSNAFPLPPHRSSVSQARPAPPPRSTSAGSIQTAGASSLFNKRAARPAPGGGLFINKPKATARPIQRSTSGTLAGNNLPRGLQRVQKTQMLDFNAATEMEQNNANAIKMAQDNIKAQQDAKKQELLEKRKRAAEEKREKEEARKAARTASARETAMAREAKELAKEALKEQASKETKEEEVTIQSPTSLTTSPKTPTSSLSPNMKYEHVFAVPLPPNQQSQQEGSNNTGDGKLSTF